MKSPPSLLPIVSLNSPGFPKPGLFDTDLQFCEQKYSESKACEQHYQKLKNVRDGLIVQCPHGFSSCAFSIGTSRFALTSFVPFPRIGGNLERKLGKQFPKKKIASSALPSVVQQCREFTRQVDEIEIFVARQQSMALHEIRKLNRTVKHTSERLHSSSTSDLVETKRKLETIWKTSELMSNQFDVLELIANESLADLPLNAISEPYRVFDKLAHIYRFSDDNLVIEMDCANFYHPKIRACDKTFPILASVLLSNAAKYSTDNTPVRVEVYPAPGAGKRCGITISNFAEDHERLDDRIFQKGERVASDTDGSGMGLYLAQLVARQHGGSIEFTKTSVRESTALVNCEFSVDFQIV
ncbi:sensor histidine kinase [Aporhodopirellula aestuarii]|uniref:Histidine kinase/HSP90-like ATPase domain-containing protein n=1 Tax=Aporhodopirellula aestuarii TaxID=2950107 RepID=A0ABT0U146_9BACT|nr:ATP-binding protein [Aporhodopirellula aestuarii]MCM2370627.1 hypothetical protein [Aporhodopirellula aestuarii]